jgi:DNA-binding ferritin-like protein
MKSLISEMSKYFHELEEDKCGDCSNLIDECICESDLDEQNVTGAIAGYNTPGAFTSEENFKKKKFKYENVNKPLAHKLDKTSNIYEKVQESMDSKYEQLIESYRKFTTDDAKMSPEQKVKRTIKDVAIKLQEIEQLVNYSSRLKTESGLSRDGYGKSVNTALTKISERLTKIAERVRALGE